MPAGGSGPRSSSSTGSSENGGAHLLGCRRDVLRKSSLRAVRGCPRRLVKFGGNSVTTTRPDNPLAQ